MKKDDSKRELLTKTPVPQLIVRLSIPTIISMLVTAIYNMADTYFVGKISTESTAAVGLVFSVMAIIQAFGFFFGQGSGNYISRMLGGGNKKEANEMAATAFAMAIISGVVVAIIGNIFINRLSLAVGADENTIKETKEYMSIILIGAPFMMGQFVINNQLRFQGSAMYAMVGLMCGALANIVLDPLLILGLKMEVKGAAIATVSGQIISFMVLFAMSMKGENIKIRFGNIRFSPYYIVEIVNGGAASLFRQGLAAVSTLLLNRYAKAYGSVDAVAAMSITTRVTMMLVSAVIGFGQGYQPVCSFNYGAGLTKRVKEGFIFCVKYSTVFLVGIGVVCFIFAPDIIALFSKNPLAIEVGVAALRFQACTLPLSGTIVISNMMLQSIGMGVKASIMASSRNGLFFIPMILILPPMLGILGVEMAQSCADVLSFVLAIPMAYSELKKFND